MRLKEIKAKFKKEFSYSDDAAIINQMRKNIDIKNDKVFFKTFNASYFYKRSQNPLKLKNILKNKLK